MAQQSTRSEAPDYVSATISADIVGQVLHRCQPHPSANHCVSIMALLSGFEREGVSQEIWLSWVGYFWGKGGGGGG